MSPRQASHFLLLRQKKVTKEKATPLRVTLRFAAGDLRCSLQAGSAQTRFAQTRAALNPPEAALLGTRRGGGRQPSLRSAEGKNKVQRAMARTCCMRGDPGLARKAYGSYPSATGSC